jgi:thiamine biosynthesis lipoprotein
VKPLALTSLLLAASLPVISSNAPAGEPRTLFRHEQSRMSMGCAYAIVAYGEDRGTLARVVEAALDEVDRIDRLMSHYKPESGLSRLNRHGSRGPVAVEAELFDLIAESLRYSRDTGGAFDVTVGPLLKAWGFFRGDGRLPSEGELAALMDRIGYRHVILDPSARMIRFDRPGVELDLGGIAKGYAVDRAVGLLRTHRVAAALVSAGGSTTFALGAPPGRAAWEVDIQDPVDPERVALTVRLKDEAVSVSGTSEKGFEVDGIRYSHVMDPRTGRPAQGVLSVAVLARSGTAGDALDNALFVKGVRASRKYLKGLPGSEALFFLPAAGGSWKLVRLHGSRGPRPSGFCCTFPARSRTSRPD